MSSLDFSQVNLGDTGVFFTAPGAASLGPYAGTRQSSSYRMPSLFASTLPPGAGVTLSPRGGFTTPSIYQQARMDLEATRARARANPPSAAERAAHARRMGVIRARWAREDADRRAEAILRARERRARDLAARRAWFEAQPRRAPQGYFYRPDTSGATRPRSAWSSFWSNFWG
jgi:hypothetical protein